VQCHGVDDRPGESCSFWDVVALCPYRSSFEGGGVEVACLAAAHVLARGCR
jgi:hypothetical protein